MLSFLSMFALSAASPLLSEGTQAERRMPVRSGTEVLLRADKMTVGVRFEQSKEGTWSVVQVAERNGLDIASPESSNLHQSGVQRLNGQYSLVARAPDGRVRLVLDRKAGRIRTYWGFMQTILGKRTSSWVELPPLEYADVGKWDLRGWSTKAVPQSDRDDLRTGFKVTRRESNWSGCFGEAYVVSFDRTMPFHGLDAKLVFWSEASWTPGWQLGDQLMHQFEFVETWDGGAKGCYEPMSDRALRFSRVEVLEDSAVRKRILWSYSLLNPDYVPWGSLDGGTQLPKVEERWTIYPDGTAIRNQRYWPCLDSRLRQTSLVNQVAEIDSVWGTRSLPEELTPDRPVLAFGLNGDTFEPRWPNGPKPPVKVTDWPVFGLVVRAVPPAMPDTWIAFRQDGKASSWCSNPPLDCSLDWEPDWHRERLWRFSHFPFNHRPFEYETNSQSEGRGDVTHSSLVYVGASADRDWERAFLTDESGRKFREWTSLVGLARPDAVDDMRSRTASWAYAADSVRGAELDIATGTLVAGSDTVEFRPGQVRIWHRPCILVGKPVASVTWNGIKLDSKEWRSASTGAGTLVWIDRVFSEPGKLRFLPRG